MAEDGSKALMLTCANLILSMMPFGVCSVPKDRTYNKQAVVIWGACHSLLCLHQAGDSELKQELGRLVDIDVWEAAKAATAERLKAARQASLQLERELTVRQSVLSRLTEEVSCLCPYPRHPV